MGHICGALRYYLTILSLLVLCRMEFKLLENSFSTGLTFGMVWRRRHTNLFEKGPDTVYLQSAQQAQFL